MAIGGVFVVAGAVGAAFAETVCFADSAEIFLGR
jgi:hypothetical protein